VSRGLKLELEEIIWPTEEGNFGERVVFVYFCFPQNGADKKPQHV